MILKNQLAEVIESQKENLAKKDPGITRAALSSIKLLPHYATIITGIRRCGKSTLLLQLLKSRVTNAFYLHFEDPRLAGFDSNDFSKLQDEINQRNPEVLFFDEIQTTDKWELFIRKLLDDGHKIVITGSNATLLSKELGTKLTGRNLPMELFPFSYNEFLTIKKIKPTNNAAENYLYSGGFPDYLKTGDGFILNQLFEDILQRDIAVRYAVKNINQLQQLAVYLISNIGKPVSANALTKLFQINATSTILDYFWYLENAYLLQFLPLFSHSLKKQVRNMKKVYAIDMGLFTENSIVFSEEKGRRLENTVYLHLRRKYKELYYFAETGECDFIAMKNGKPAALIQACYDLNNDNLNREVKGLLAALDFFKVKKGKIITLNTTDTLKTEGKEIEVISLNDFLSEDA